MWGKLGGKGVGGITPNAVWLTFLKSLTSDLITLVLGQVPRALAPIQKKKTSLYAKLMSLQSFNARPGRKHQNDICNLP